VTDASEAATNAVSATIPFDAVRRWTFDVALPFWADVGLDGELGFVEQLDLQGRPADVPFKRMRVQARQVYVYSHAAALGWKDGLKAAENGYRFMLEHGRLPEGGWARTLGREGGVLDPALDLYDQAFVIFAFAWFHRATGEPEAARLIAQTLDAIERRLGREDGRGFLVALPDPGEELQNPHMHLLEAMLAAYEAGGQGRYAEAASRLVRLFADRMFDPATGTLGEYFGPDWAPAPGERGRIVEPGHQFEWSWLLRHHGRLTGQRHDDQALRMFAFGEAHGIDAGTGLAVDELTSDGALLKGSSRLWPQTELLKARLARAEFDQAVDAAGIAAAANNLLDRYIAPGPNGAWRDQIGPDGRFLCERVPASSFYHVFLAFSELLRLEPVLKGATA
jgi:mannose/cellobiose epimerase-like protein (N-acyl-D-glucosamine 2-epimerase family)